MLDEQRGLYIISVASRLLSMHPQTLRKYERAGFLAPNRTGGMLRLYSSEDIARLALIKHLVDDLGLNLAGVELGLKLAAVLGQMEEDLDQHAADPDLAPRLRRSLDRAADLLGLAPAETPPQPEPQVVRRTIRIRHYVRADTAGPAKGAGEPS